MLNKKTNSFYFILLIAMGLFISSCGNTRKKTNDGATNSQEVPASEESSVSNEAEETHEIDKLGAGAHQGIIEEAGEANHIEMVIVGKDVNFYLLDELTNSMDINGWTGKGTFQYKNGTTKTVELMSMDGMLMATGMNIGSFKAIVTFMMNGKSISAQFNRD